MTGADRLPVSLTFTVLNEAATIDELLGSIAKQRRQPDEIIVVDAGSTDETVECLRSWSGTGTDKLRIIEVPGVSIAEGRNIALQAASGAIVAVTDAGVRLDPRWLERLAGRLESDASIDVAAGSFRAAPRTVFELALGVTTLPDVEEIDPAQFLPSSRSIAFRRSWIEAGIGYPDWLDFCEDLVFDLRLKRAGARFALVPDALVEYRPRPSPIAHWRQYRNYASGDGKSGLFLKRHLIRYTSYGVLVALLATHRRSNTAVVGVASALYLRKPWQRLCRRRHEFGPAELLTAWAMTPFIRLLGDLAKMAGYPAGLRWRHCHYGLRRSWKTIGEKRP